MSKIIGFLNIDDFVSNTNGVVNPVGEISNSGLTFSREVKLYPTVESSFLMFFTDTIAGAELAVLEAVNVDISNKLNGIRNGLPGTGTPIDEVTTVLGANVANIIVDTGVINPLDGLDYPGWIEFTLTSNGFNWEVKIFLSDAVWLTDYDQGQIEIVYPLDDMTQAYNNYSLAEANINALDQGSLITKAAVQITVPVTGYQYIGLTLFNVADMSESVTLPFSIAYNGPRTVNTDLLMIEGILAGLLDTGAYTAEEWIYIIPDLVPVNSFRLVARWGNIAVDNIALTYPLCSPTVDLVDGTTLAGAYWSGMAEADVLSHIQYTVALYKSIGLYILPSINNPDGRLKWNGTLEDYIIITTNDININQLSAATQNAIIILDQLLRVAEAYVTGDTLEAGYSKETDGAYEYISKRTGTIRLSILTRESYLANPV